MPEKLSDVVRPSFEANRDLKIDLIKSREGARGVQPEKAPLDVPTQLIQLCSSRAPSVRMHLVKWLGEVKCYY